MVTWFMLSEKSGNSFSSKIVTIAKQFETVWKQRLYLSVETVMKTLIAGRPHGATGVAMLSTSAFQ